MLGFRSAVVNTCQSPRVGSFTLSDQTANLRRAFTSPALSYCAVVIGWSSSSDTGSGLVVGSMLDSAIKCEFPERCEARLHLNNTMATLPSMDINHLLSAVDQDLHSQQQQQQNEKKQSNCAADNSNPERHLNVVLEDRDLWEKFKEFTNEMIVTKNGR